MFRNQQRPRVSAIGTPDLQQLLYDELLPVAATSSSPPSTTLSTPPTSMSALQFSINGRSNSATRFTSTARQFTLVTDEPPALGGTDAAPNPVELLLAGYAGCLNVLLHLVAAEQLITVRSININISGELDPANFLGLSAAKRPGFEKIQATIFIDAEATPTQLVHLLQVARERCPVGDNLANATPIGFKLELPEIVAN